MVNELDCRGLPCPLPIVRLRELMGQLPAGEQIQMTVSTEQSADNVRRFLQGYFALTVEFRAVQDGFTTGFANPGVGESGDGAPAYTCDTAPVAAPQCGGTVLLISASELGQGDGHLGEILMKGFLSTLESWETLPQSLLLLNGGVRLTDRRSGPVPTLEALQERGVEILVCGTCVNHFGLQEHVAVGRISNMFEISQRLSAAGCVVRL